MPRRRPSASMSVRARCSKRPAAGVWSGGKKTCSSTSPSISSTPMRPHHPRTSEMTVNLSHAGPRDAVDVASYVADAAAHLGDGLAELVSAIASLVPDEIEDLRDDALIELLYAAIEGNVTTLLQALRCGIAPEHVQAPTAALEHARRLAQHGVPVNTLVRAYRLGQRRMTELVFSELAMIDMTAQVRITVVEKIIATLFSYIDRVSEQVVAAYEEEREQWLDSHNSIRSLRVRELLAARTPVDVDAASTAIRY